MATDPRVSFVIPARSEDPAEPRRPARAAVVVQNTRGLRPAFPLLCLPASCSGRLTDTWRSDVARRVAGEHDWHLLVDGPTTRQARNPHDPMHDFRREMAGYWHGWELGRSLADLSLPGADLGDAMLRRYERLVTMRLVDREELPRLETWLAEVA